MQIDDKISNINDAETKKQPAKQGRKKPAQSTKAAAKNTAGRRRKPVKASQNEPAQAGANTPATAPAKSQNRRTRGAKGNAQAQPSATQDALTKAAQAPKTRGGKNSKKEGRKPILKIIPLGGLNEIGKNMTAYECGNDILIVDCGMAFPDEDMLGIDIVLPDFTYIEKNRDRVRGVVITHGHEDHIGGLAYLLKTANVPVYATRLTIGLIEGKLAEHGMLGKAKLNVVKPKDVVKLGCMSVEFIAVNHSIPDACGMAIHTPAGIVVQTGDFKIDYTPIQGEIIDLARFGELGSQGVLALLSDSTNAERPGSTVSERKVGQTFESLFAMAEGRRIIIASFSSNVHRVQQIIDAAVHYGRKVAVSGRSMVNVVTKAIELGYLFVPEGLLVDIDMVKRYRDDKMVIITTGSQGEPMSALYRMAMNDHRKVTVTPNDFIIISAKPIPGNEKLVSRVVNELMKQGARVIYENMYDVHVSGHACQDELKLMLGLVRPKFFIPVHGEYRHLKRHADLALSMGLEPSHVIIGDIGRVIETDGVDMHLAGVVPSGSVMVDGLGVGDVGSVVLRDRKHLSEDGLIVVVAALDSTGVLTSGPDIVSRGFVYVRESEKLMEDAKVVVRAAIENCTMRGMRDWNSIKLKIREDLSNFVYQKTKRNPMILPIIMEV